MPLPLKTFGAGGILFPGGPSVSECAAEKPVNTISQKPIKGISPNFESQMYLG